MAMPTNIDSEAIRLLQEADYWPWSDFERAFIAARDLDKETLEEYNKPFQARISYEELQFHSLAGPDSGTGGGASLASRAVVDLEITRTFPHLLRLPPASLLAVKPVKAFSVCSFYKAVELKVRDIANHGSL